ncbi:hypothetical protein AXE77_01800 [Gardnerella vaginalis]|uniref:Uncharacterized protein n=1 Tax=Gardnerella vaginalis TaxID=2702 RepID=A0A3E1J1M8_GARVA|nr:hypothetical protein AXE77_01800 [Gardnerella vaginalis]
MPEIFPQMFQKTAKAATNAGDFPANVPEALYQCSADAEYCCIVDTSIRAAAHVEYYCLEATSISAAAHTAPDTPIYAPHRSLVA